MWRSPEAHASGPVNKPSDMFSFGIVVSNSAPVTFVTRHSTPMHVLISPQCIYAVQEKILFAVDENELGEGEEVLAHVLERQISYFADKDGLDGLLQHLGDSPWVEIFGVIRDGFNTDNPRRPFFLWEGVDEGFKDLVGCLTNFDPAQRVMAREALEHPWFS
jgi:serine/threonine protein kinase